MPKWRKSTWAIVIWTTLIIIWVIGAGGSADCASQTGDGLLSDSDAQTACAAGTGLGILFILLVGFFGFVFLSLIWIMTRSKARPCPVCGNDVKKGITVCGSCGHDFAAAVAAQPSTRSLIADDEEPAPARGWSRQRIGAAAALTAAVILVAGIGIGTLIDRDAPASVEAAAPVPTIEPTPAPTPAPTPRPARPRSTPAGPAAPNACPGGVRAGATTTCQFAGDIAGTYGIALEGGTLNPDGSGVVGAWSEAVQDNIDLYCEPEGGDIVCTGGNAAVVRFARP